ARSLARLRAAEPGERGRVRRIGGHGSLEGGQGLVDAIGVERRAALGDEVERLRLDVVGTQDGQEAERGESGGQVSHRSLPSEISSTRSADDMMRGSCVEKTKVVRRSRLRRRMSSTMS